VRPLDDTDSQTADSCLRRFQSGSTLHVRISPLAGGTDVLMIVTFRRRPILADPKAIALLGRANVLGRWSIEDVVHRRQRQIDSQRILTAAARPTFWKTRHASRRGKHGARQVLKIDVLYKTEFNGKAWTRTTKGEGSKCGSY
jgi:hypothetical protein